MESFKKQILEDIDDYRKKFPHMQHIEKDEWAFNFWILDKLFSVDEELIEEHIIDYNDKGIDCYVWHEDTKDLYLIQNKYYGDETPLKVSYILDDFLTRPIGSLEKGTYSRCKELQRIYDVNCEDEDFCIYFYIYVTNKIAKTPKIKEALAKYNEQFASKRYTAKMFDITDIEEAYFGEPIKEKINFKYTLWTVNKGTKLDINNEEYGLNQVLDGRYVLTPIICLYRMVKTAKEKNYPLFEENIREYLGANGQVNKGIKRTLESSVDRKNFFFYNNGITMIVNEIGDESMNGGRREFKVDNPQIVNGCQTVSTIYDTLSGLREDTLEEEFRDTYVMLKILKIPSNDASLKELYKNIVRYNNSQNSINEKAFEAASSIFKRIQTELEGKGFLLCIKQSDKYSFSIKYKTATALKALNHDFISRFGLENYIERKDYNIELEKFLQVLMSFVDTPQIAVQKKSKLLVHGSSENTKVVEFIRQPELTANDYLFLYLLYLRAEKEKQKSKEGKMPNAFYMIYCFSRYECKGDISSISSLLSNKTSIDNIIKKYTLAISQYYKLWTEENEGKEYNDMIKSAINSSLMDRSVENAADMMEVYASFN